MKAKIASVTRVTLTNENGNPETRSRVAVALDDELATLLGQEDMSVLLMKELVYFFSVVASEALIAGTIRNDISERKRRLSNGRLQKGLVGKEFDL